VWTSAKDLSAAVQRALASVLRNARREPLVALPAEIPDRDRGLLRWEMLEACGESPLALSNFGAVRVSRRLPTYQREWTMAVPVAGHSGSSATAARRPTDGRGHEIPAAKRAAFP
jgi:hypothetical protein